MNFTETEKAGLVEGFALVKACDKKSAKNGTFYLDIKLGDKDSEMVAKMWDFREDMHTLPEVNTVIKKSNIDIRDVYKSNTLKGYLSGLSSSKINCFFETG